MAKKDAMLFTGKQGHQRTGQFNHIASMRLDFGEHLALPVFEKVSTIFFHPALVGPFRNGSYGSCDPFRLLVTSNYIMNQRITA